MVNKAICHQISDFAFDVHYSGVQVVDVVPVRAEEDVVGVLSLSAINFTVSDVIDIILSFKAKLCRHEQKRKDNRNCPLSMSLRISISR